LSLILPGRKRLNTSAFSRTRGLIIVVALSVLAVLGFACGGGDEDPADETTGETAVSVTNGSVAVEMQDNRFVQNRIEAPMGQNVTVNLTNDGNSIHNMRLAGPDNRFDTSDDNVSSPETVRSGQTATLSFNLASAGTYDFRCDFHPTDMTGSIIVGQ
jgi:plastocyanin